METLRLAEAFCRCVFPINGGCDTTNTGLIWSRHALCPFLVGLVRLSHIRSTHRYVDMELLLRAGMYVDKSVTVNINILTNILIN